MEETNPDALSDQLQVIRNFCLGRKFTIAVAESVTAGLVQALLSTMPEAGLFYQGGVTVYTCEAKSRLLDIPMEATEPINGVSADVADLMAQQICRVFQADLGLAITGYASFVPELGIVTKFAFGSISLCGKCIHQCSLVSTEPSQFATQRDFAIQLIRACADTLGKMEAQKD